MERISQFSFKWYDSLQFKMSAIFFVLFLIIALSVIMVLKTFGNELIEEEAYLRLNKADHVVAAELEKRTVLSATLADTIANLAEKLPSDVSLHKELILQLMNYKGTEEFIAGGGVWPAPFQFDADIERRSFFWGRNQSGMLEFYDDYNQQEGNGYHHEEWYVPATQLAEGNVYWSKSYTDPYSLQPMVTVTAPMINDGRNIGVATIDLKLEGLQQLLEKVTDSFGGYAFAIDRNGTFLSYPDIYQVISTVKNRDGSELKSFISYRDLAEKSPEFSKFAAVLDEERNHLMRSVNAKNRLRNELSSKLAEGSYQINQEEANIIAASMLSSTQNTDSGIFKHNHNNFFLENDPLLNESVFVSVSMMPDTYWKIVTVMPYSRGIERIVATYDRLMLATFSAVLLAIFIIWLLIRRIVTAPISHLSKQIQSQVDSKASDINLFDTSAKGELGALAQVFNQRTEQLLDTQNEIKKLAHFDSLTGLPNRRLLVNRLNEKLEISKRQNCYGALLFIDLDNFKLINDSLGHDMGDELLVRVAERFQKCIRREDTVARLGGDEFVVLIVKNNAYSEQLNHESTVVARKLVRAMEKPFELSAHQHHVTISIGLTVFSSQNSSSDELLRQADTAMYRAKGKNGFCFFKPQMQEQADRRLNIEEALRIALDQGQLFLMYQPQVDSQGTCRGAEALIRWSHPKKGMLPPAEFIAIAEDSGLIIPLGTWVIDEACRQLKSWSDQEKRLEKIAVNVSPKQFRHINFVDSVRGSIEKHQISASQLTLELTEGIVINDIKDTIDKMSILKSIGVHISIDDFGTGYSSLMYLKMLPLDQLKIDQSFVRDIISETNNAMIVETIIAMSNHFGLNVIAEGVENKEQMDFLLEKGCQQFQGYYFGKPMNVEDFSDYMRQQPVSKVYHDGFNKNKIA